MARMPDVPFLNVRSSPMKRWDVICIHTIVGFQSGGNAAHFTTSAQGHIIQARDTNQQSAANYDGNHRVIAIENEDHGPEFGGWNINDGHDVPGFTSAQMEAIAKIIAWAATEHNIPIELCSDSKPGTRGIAYHRQGIDGNFGTYQFSGRSAGGEKWSTHFGKVCPGDKRIRQLIDIIIPRARRLAQGLPEPTEEEAVAIAIDLWPAGFPIRDENGEVVGVTEEWGVIAVPPVGGSLSVGPNGQAWVHLRWPNQPVIFKGVWIIDTTGNTVKYEPQRQLPNDVYHRWQLPKGAMQFSVLYESRVPIAATLETKV